MSELLRDAVHVDWVEGRGVVGVVLEPLVRDRGGGGEAGASARALDATAVGVVVVNAGASEANHEVVVYKY